MAALSVGNVNTIRVEHGPVTATPKVQKRSTTEDVTKVTNKSAGNGTAGAEAADTSNVSDRLKLEADYKYIQSDSNGDTLAVTKQGAEALDNSVATVRSSAGSGTVSIQARPEAVSSKTVSTQSAVASNGAAQSANASAGTAKPASTSGAAPSGGMAGGTPPAKPAATTTAATTTATTTSSSTSSQITSYAGINDDTLYKYYIEGKITKADYDAEMAIRRAAEAASQATQAATNNAASTKATTNAEKTAGTENTANTSNTANVAKTANTVNASAMSKANYQIESAATLGNAIENANPNVGVDGMNGTDRLNAAIKATESENEAKTTNPEKTIG